MITLQLPPELETQLQNLARETRQPLEALVAQALADYLEDQEDLRRAEQSLAKLRAGSSRLIPLEELIARPGRAD